MRRFLMCAMLLAAVARADELRVDDVRESLTGTHIHYQRYVDGVPLVGSDAVERIPRGGQMPSVIRNEDRRGRLSSARTVYVRVDGVMHRAVQRLEEDRAHRRYLRCYDINTGALLQETPLFFHAAAQVFDPNPVAKLNAPQLQDQNNAASAVPASAYSVVDLAGLSASGPLAGPNVKIVDTDAPFTTRAEASQSLLFDRSQPQFEEVNAYFHIDRSQRYLQSLGYTGTRRIAGYAIPVDAHAAAGSDNSLFSIGDVPGEGALFFGDGGTDDAEDSDIMLHEFAHAIHESIAPGVFSGAPSSEARAMAEGFGDYWAFSSGYAGTIASGRDPFCIGDWDARCWTDDSSQRCGYPAGSDCLRRVDSVKTMADFLHAGDPGTEHLNGAIWSSALREIFEAIVRRYGVESGRRLTDTVVLESLFDATADPKFADQARHLIDADLALTGGVNRDVICPAMTTRAILAIADCGVPPRGNLTVFQSATATIHVDDPRSVDAIFIRVQTDGGAGPVTLVAPDGTEVVLSETAPIDATYGVDALPQQSLSALQGRAAAGDWHLIVGAAQLRSWSLMIRFAGDASLVARPMTSDLRHHIAVAGHVVGAANQLFVTDLRVFNRSAVPVAPMLIFTPSGGDGRTAFAAVRLSIEPRHLVVLTDVVASTLQSSGIGQLELLGDFDRIIVNTRTYSPGGAGTFGDTIPDAVTTEAGADVIAPLQNTSALRSNVGVAEVMGNSGTVVFTFFSSGGALLDSTEVAVAPFGHVQVRVPAFGADLRAVVTVVSGAPRVLAYGSIIDNLSGDAVTIPAVRVPQSMETVAIPTIRAAGAGGTDWHSDVWRIAASGSVAVHPDAGHFLEATFIENAGGVVSSRTYTSAGGGTFGEFIPALHAAQGQAVQHLIGISQTAAFRTNIGLINFADATATATIVAYDRAGGSVGRITAVVPGRSLQQLPLANIVASALDDGRIEVDGPVAAYASVIDNRTQDPSFILGQH